MSYSFDWSYPAVFFWGLLIITSFIGWGRSIGLWLVREYPAKNVGWGLEAAWGVSMFLALSGPLLALSVFSSGFVLLFLMSGLLLMARHCYIASLRKDVRDRTSQGYASAPGIGILLFLGLFYLGAVGANWYNPYDDLAAYFPLIKMVLDTGTMLDPFSFRLMSSLGGQTILDTTVAAFFPWKYANMVDLGISALIVIWMTQEVVGNRDEKEKKARLVLGLIALTVGMPQTNLSSEYTSVMLFMAFFRSLDLVVSRRLQNLPASLLLGGVVMAASTLRANNIFIIAVLAMCFVAWRLLNERQAWRQTVKASLLTVLFSVIFLLPWWEVVYRSSGAFLYPLIRGNHRPEFELYTSHLSFPDTLRFIGDFLMSTSYILFFAPMFFLQPGRHSRLLFIYGMALIGLSIAFLSQLTFVLYYHLYRYLVPMALAYALYASGVVAQQLMEKPVGGRFLFRNMQTKLAVIVAIMVVLVQGFAFLPQCINNLMRLRWVTDAQYQVRARLVGPVFTDIADRDYRAAFSCIPPGAGTLIALDYPYLLDYRAHAISSIDVAGAASPAPGLPYFQGSRSVKEYLLAHGICYIAQVPFDRSVLLHSRKKQAESLAGPVPAYRFFAKFEINFFDNIDQLAQSNRILYDSPNIRVIDLRDK